MSLRSQLAADLRRYYRRDTSLFNIVWCTLLEPGFQTVLLYRIRNRLVRIPKVGSLLQTIVGQLAITLTGCQISPHCKIGPGLYLPHPIGIVIARHAVIGAGVEIYQNVTLGQLTKDIPAAPKLEDRVCLYAGCVLLGDITVGEGAQVGANAVVLQNVLAGKIAVGIPARIISPKKA